MAILRWFVNLLPYEWLSDRMARLEKFHRTGGRTSQREVFREVLHYYPRNTRFVVLPMDMRRWHGRSTGTSVRNMTNWRNWRAIPITGRR